MDRIGKELLKSKKYKIPSMRKMTKFTEKYKKYLDLFISNMDIPDFMSITITEEKPYEVMITSNVDFEKFLIFKLFYQILAQKYFTFTI